jgi:hypothetical protein
MPNNTASPPARWTRPYSLPVQPALHHHEPIVAHLIFGVGVINEKPREVEEAGEVGHYERDVDGFEPEIERLEGFEHGPRF